MGHRVASTRRRVRRRSTALVLASVTTAVVGAVAIATTAGSASERGSGPGAVQHHEVTLCHATGSRTNPYVRITVDDDAVVREGHGAHTGPVFDPALPAHVAWGDVIPAFDYGSDARFPGLNLSDAGRALLAKGCGGHDEGHPQGPPTPPGSHPEHPGGPGPDHPGDKPHDKPDHPDHPGDTRPGGGPAGPATTTPTTKAAVKGVTESAPPTTTVAAALPVTGARTGLLAGLALVLVASGAGVLVLRRRGSA